HHTSEDHGNRSLKFVPGKSRGDEGVIVRPDRTIVIRHRIVARLAASYCPNSPSGKGCFIRQGCRNTPRMFLGSDACKQTMTSIRRSHPARTLAAVQSDGICGNIFTPEDFLEPAAQALGLVLQLSCSCAIA